MIDATTALTPDLRARLDDALDDLANGESMFAEGALLYKATLDTTPDGAPVGDLVDVADLLGWNDLD